VNPAEGAPPLADVPVIQLSAHLRTEHFASLFVTLGFWGGLAKRYVQLG
jgi:hypothetical protein